jgi:hypothetical protein
VSSVTTAPTINVVRLSDGVSIANGNMTLVANTQLVYTFPWNTSNVQNGDYMAVTSYVADGVVVTSRMFDRVRVGDSRVTGAVALDATVAKDASVAKDTTVAHATDIQGINPANSATILAIKAKTDALPSDPASTTTLNALLALINDIHDGQIGSMVIDKTTTPWTMTIRRDSTRATNAAGNSVLATYQLSEDNNGAQRLAVPVSQ